VAASGAFDSARVFGSERVLEPERELDVARALEVERSLAVPAVDRALVARRLPVGAASFRVSGTAVAAALFVGSASSAEAASTEFVIVDAAIFAIADRDSSVMACACAEFDCWAGPVLRLFLVEVSPRCLVTGS
jgi:hypothetical protein